MPRDYESELDRLEQQMKGLEQLVRGFMEERGMEAGNKGEGGARQVKGAIMGFDHVRIVGSLSTVGGVDGVDGADVVAGIDGVMGAERGNGTDRKVRTGRSDFEDEGSVYYSGRLRTDGLELRLAPSEKRISDLLGVSAEKAGKVLAALGHRQRLELLLAVWKRPLTGTELVERLQMGTTGQLYHHLKSLTGADLLSQEERGGRYTVPAHRRFPLLLLFAAVSDLLDTSEYIGLSEVRGEAHAYMGTAGAGGYDPHELFAAVLDNCLLEHKAGYCSEVRLYLHEDGSATVADNGRGIPTSLLPQSGKPVVQAVMTELDRFKSEASYRAPGAGKGISITVVNALSLRLSVEVRRDGSIYRQDYRHGIPQTSLLPVGATGETGTSVTFCPDPELFAGGFKPDAVEKLLEQQRQSYPDLLLRLLNG